MYPFGEYMTAEIVIMNREAVVIAADSALSLMMGQTDRPQKIVTSSSKIFDLSPHHAVIIMIFNMQVFFRPILIHENHQK